MKINEHEKAWNQYKSRNKYQKELDPDFDSEDNVDLRIALISQGWKFREIRPHFDVIGSVLSIVGMIISGILGIAIGVGIHAWLMR